MKHLRIFAVIALAASLLTGCDFVRSILGKPTSKDIARIRMEQEALRKAEKDSLAALAAKDTLQAEKAARPAAPQYRYYVILGSFINYSNADRFMDKLTSMGYSPVKFQFNNGFAAVGVEGTDNLPVAYEKCAALNGKDFLEDDMPWVYDIQTMKL